MSTVLEGSGRGVSGRGVSGSWCFAKCWCWPIMLKLFNVGQQKRNEKCLENKHMGNSINVSSSNIFEFNLLVEFYLH